jgi:hypothetical protein
MSSVRLVRIKKFCEMTGYTQKAVYHKIADGVWMQNREYRRGPDNNILIDLEGYENWALNRPAPLKQGRSRSASSSAGTARE